MKTSHDDDDESRWCTNRMKTFHDDEPVKVYSMLNGIVIAGLGGDRYIVQVGRTEKPFHAVALTSIQR